MAILLIHSMALFLLAVLGLILACKLRRLAKLNQSAMSSIEHLQSGLCQISDDFASVGKKLNSIAVSMKEIDLADAKTVNRRINRLIYRVNQLEFRIEAAEILTRRHEEALSQTLVEEQTQYKPSNKIPQQ